jgi:AcrR family transcriptional regulator
VGNVQRGRLIDAFVQIVAENGYESAGIKLICQRAGVALNTFYDHFRSKEQLFLAAYDLGVDMLFRATSAAFLAADQPWRDRVDAGLGTFLQMLADNPSFARFFALEIHQAGEEARNRIDASIEAASAMFSNVQPAPGVNIPEIELVPLIVGAIYEQIYVYIRTGRTRELPRLTPILVEFAAHLLSTADFGRAEP